MIDKVSSRDGVGDIASKGVKALSRQIGQGSERFAVHVKGHELAAHNIQANPPRGLCYATANRGACHLNGDNIAVQNTRAMLDSIGLCLFPALEPALEESTLLLLNAITGQEYDKTEFMKTGERIFNLEKLFNYREGFRSEDDRLPDRFFEDAFTIGPKKGSVLNRERFDAMMTQYYMDRGWDPKTTKPSQSKLRELGLDSI